MQQNVRKIVKKKKSGDAKGEDFHGFWAPGSKVEWNKWTHIAWVVSEDSILKGYMNGNLVGSLRMEASKQTFNEGNNVNGVMRCPYNHPTCHESQTL